MGGAGAIQCVGGRCRANGNSTHRSIESMSNGLDGKTPASCGNREEFRKGQERENATKEPETRRAYHKEKEPRERITECGKDSSILPRGLCVCVCVPRVLYSPRPEKVYVFHLIRAYRSQTLTYTYTHHSHRFVPWCDSVVGNIIKTSANFANKQKTQPCNDLTKVFHRS